MLLLARTFSDIIQSEGDEGRIGEERSESVISLIPLSVDMGKESLQRSKGEGFALIIVVYFLLGHQDYRSSKASFGRWLVPAKLDAYTQQCVPLFCLLLLDRGTKKGSDIVLLPGIDDLRLDLFGLFGRRCSGLRDSHCF